MRTKTAFTACLLLGFVLGGCATSRTQSTSMETNRQDAQIQRLNSQVGQLEDSRPSQAETWSQLQSMRQELNAVNGKIHDLYDGRNTEVDMLKNRIYRLENLIRQMGSQMAVNTDSLDAPIDLDGPRTLPEGYSPYNRGAAAPASGGLSYAIPPVSEADVSVPTPEPAPIGDIAGGSGIAVTTDGNLSSDTSEASGVRDTAATLYDGGIKAFDERRYQDAVMAFKDFSSTFPKHNLAGNAHFWEGESYFQLKDYARAALAYQEVISKFPGGNKVQSAMLKQGIALYNANKKPAGRERLQELVNRYPKSQEATRAKDFLAKNK